MASEVGRTHIVDVEAGATVPPEGHFLYARDTDNTYSSDGTTLTLFATGSGAYSDEEAQDAVGGILTDTATIDFTYSDATPSITADVKNDSITYAKIQNVTTDRLLGRDTAGTGDTEEITVSDGVEFSGSTGIVSSSRTLDRDASVNTFNTTTTETTIYSYTIPANTLGANDEIYTRILNYYLNNTGSASGYIIKVKLGGTTVIDFDTTTFFGSNSAKRLVKVDIYISSLGATNSQYVTMQINHASGSTPSGSITTGEGALWSNNIGNVQLGSGVLSQDMTSSKVFEVSIQLSTSSASHEWSSYSTTTQLHSV